VIRSETGEGGMSVRESVGLACAGAEASAATTGQDSRTRAAMAKARST